MDDTPYFLLDPPPCICGSNEWMLGCHHKAGRMVVGIYACPLCTRAGQYIAIGEDHAFIEPCEQVSQLSHEAIGFIAHELYVHMCRNYEELERMRERFEHEQYARLVYRPLTVTHVNNWRSFSEAEQDEYLNLAVNVYTDERWWWPNGYRQEYPVIPEDLVVRMRTNLNYVLARRHSGWFRI